MLIFCFGVLDNVLRVCACYHNISVIKFVCLLQAFSLDFNLRSHMKTHSQENYHICPYPDCGKRYAHEYKLKNHIASHHEKVGRLVLFDHSLLTLYGACYHVKISRFSLYTFGFGVIVSFGMLIYLISIQVCIIFRKYIEDICVMVKMPRIRN